MPSKPTTIFCSANVRSLWGHEFAHEWLRSYPDIFDDDDLRLVKTQPTRHFPEWFAAIHLYHRDGALSLVEKYGCCSHPRKLPVWESLFTKRRRQLLDTICADEGVQGPDLLVYAPDKSWCYFAEVKGPGDRLSTAQVLTHRKMLKQCGVATEVINVTVLSAVVS
jgi:hypothetical protein